MFWPVKPRSSLSLPVFYFLASTFPSRSANSDFYRAYSLSMLQLPNEMHPAEFIAAILILGLGCRWVQNYRYKIISQWPWQFYYGHCDIKTNGARPMSSCSYEDVGVSLCSKTFWLSLMTLSVNDVIDTWHADDKDNPPHTHNDTSSLQRQHWETIWKGLSEGKVFCAVAIVPYVVYMFESRCAFIDNMFSPLISGNDSRSPRAFEVQPGFGSRSRSRDWASVFTKDTGVPPGCSRTTAWHLRRRKLRRLKRKSGVCLLFAHIETLSVNCFSMNLFSSSTDRAPPHPHVYSPICNTQYEWYYI